MRIQTLSPSTRWPMLSGDAFSAKGALSQLAWGNAPGIQSNRNAKR